MQRSLLFLCVASFLSVAPTGCGTETTDQEEDADVVDNELNTRTSLFANDVSIVFPLPKGADKDKLLAPTSAGAKGELLPETTFTKIPRLVAEGATRDDMRVVSLRIDPCFPGLGVADPAGCKNQIRLVLQPIDASAANESINAKDAAVHAFYTMSREEFGAMSREILTAKRGARGSVRTALGVHPLIEEQGLDGTFAMDVKAVVLKHAGKENLTRVTFMTREPPRQPLWKFGGFDISTGESNRHTKMKIASLGDATEQTVGGLMRNLNANPAIAAPAPDNLSLLLRSFDADAASAPKLLEAYTATLRVQNPTMHSPDTIDCVSCHTATSSRIWAEKNKGQKAEGNTAAFKARFSTSLSKSPSAERADNLHSFSYLGKDLSISQRTANESAAVAEYINTKILGSR